MIYLYVPVFLLPVTGLPLSLFNWGLGSKPFLKEGLSVWSHLKAFWGKAPWPSPSMPPHPVLEHPKESVRGGKSDTAEPTSLGYPCSWEDFLSLLCDLAQDILCWSASLLAVAGCILLLISIFLLSALTWQRRRWVPYKEALAQAICEARVGKASGQRYPGP